MKLLLDTHTFIWWIAGDPRLKQKTSAAIASDDNEVQVSVVSLWEILVKVRARKLAADIAELEREIEENGFERLPISKEHLKTLAALPFRHRDPFDQLLVAQSISEKAALVTSDRELRNYPVDLFE